MAEIRELGESLLSRTRTRNKRNFERGRKEAYKIALMQGGISLFKNSLRSKATDFLNSEEAMAARVKQRQGFEDAQFFRTQEDAMVSSGLSQRDYLMQQSLPQAKLIADATSAEQNFNPDQYEAYLFQETERIVGQRLDSHRAGLNIANTIESPEDFAAFQMLQAQKAGSTSNWLTSSLSKIFGGKNQQELDQATIQAISDSDMVNRAATVTALRGVYARSGDLTLAIDVAGAVERGDIQKKDPVIDYEQIGSAPVTSQDRWGNTTITIPYRVTIDGQVQTKNGIPITVFSGQNNGSGFSPGPDLTQALNIVTPGEISTTATTRQAIMRGQSADQQRSMAEYEVATYGEDDTEGLDKTLAASALLAADKFVVASGEMDIQSHQRLQVQMLFNDLQSASDRDASFFLPAFMEGRKLDMKNMGLNKLPESIAMTLALGDLEGSYVDGVFQPGINAITFNTDDLRSMFPNFQTDLATLTPEEQQQVKSRMESEPDKFTWFFGVNPLQESPATAVGGAEPITSDTPLPTIIQDNQDKEFIRRLLNPSSAPAPIQNADGSISTHLMAAEVDDEGNWHVFPTIINEGGQLVKKPLREAQAHALSSGEVISFGQNKEAALNFAENYKDGLTSRTRSELTDNQIQRDAGFFNEAVDSAIVKISEFTARADQLPKTVSGVLSSLDSVIKREVERAKTAFSRLGSDVSITAKNVARQEAERAQESFSRLASDTINTIRNASRGDPELDEEIVKEAEDIINGMKSVLFETYKVLIPPVISPLVRF